MPDTIGVKLYRYNELPKKVRNQIDSQYVLSGGDEKIQEQRISTAKEKFCRALLSVGIRVYVDTIEVFFSKELGENSARFVAMFGPPSEKVSFDEVNDIYGNDYKQLLKYYHSRLKDMVSPDQFVIGSCNPDGDRFSVMYELFKEGNNGKYQRAEITAEKRRQVTFDLLDLMDCIGEDLYGYMVNNNIKPDKLKSAEEYYADTYFLEDGHIINPKWI